MNVKTLAYSHSNRTNNMATTAKPTKVELADGDGKAQQIFLYQLEEEAEEGSGKVTVKFWLDVARLAQVHFKLDLSGSENVEIKSSAPVADHAVEVSCKPFARTDLCAIDLGSGGSLNFTYSWKEEAPDEKAEAPPTPPKEEEAAAEPALERRPRSK